MKKWLWKNKFILLGSFFFTVFVAVVYATGPFAEKYFLTKIEEVVQSQRSHYDLVLKDLKLLEAHPIFSKGTRNKNAEDLISKHVSWQGKDVHPLEGESQALIQSFFEKYKVWRSEPKLLNALINDPGLQKIDTSWIEELENYDHWNFSDSKYLKDTFSGAENFTGVEKTAALAAMPIPAYGELSMWATVHVLKSARNGKLTDGLRIYRKVSELIHSSNLLVGNMVVANMLKGEPILAERLNAKNWKSVAPEVRAAYKRISWAWPALLMGSRITSSEFPEQFAPYLKTEYGVCAGVTESVLFYPVFQAFFEPKWIFELDYSDKVSKEKVFQKKLLDVCGMQNFEVFMKPSTETVLIVDMKKSFDLKRTIAGEMPLEADAHKWAINWEQVPYARRTVGFILASIGIPNYMRLYEDPQTN